MARIIDQRYKEIVQRVEKQYDTTQFNKAVQVLEELDSDKEYDYSTIAKAVIEAYLGKEIEIE